MRVAAARHEVAYLHNPTALAVRWELKSIPQTLFLYILHTAFGLVVGITCVQSGTVRGHHVTVCWIAGLISIGFLALSV